MTPNCADFYDAELARHNRHLAAAAGIGPRERVLDVGCGAGQTTRQAARAAVDGEAVGVDTSAPMLEVARRRCAEEGLHNAAFEHGDAQVHPFPAARYDVCISRFGVMFFADPAAAFAHLGRALRPGARLVWMVWQAQERNEWSVAVRRALAADAAPTRDALAPFSLGDAAATAALLRAAGFVSVDFAEVREPVYYGPTADAAFDALAGFAFVKDAFAGTSVPPGEAARRLRALLEAHASAEGVLFDARAWIVTARRAGG
jgi:SAM-dependent methyltransferase